MMGVRMPEPRVQTMAAMMIGRRRTAEAITERFLTAWSQMGSWWWLLDGRIWVGDDDSVAYVVFQCEAGAGGAEGEEHAEGYASLGDDLERDEGLLFVPHFHEDKDAH